MLYMYCISCQLMLSTSYQQKQRSFRHLRKMERGTYSKIETATCRTQVYVECKFSVRQKYAVPYLINRTVT